MKPETSSRAPRRGQALRPGRCSMYFTSCTPMAAILSAPSAMASAGTKNKSATGGRALVLPVAWRIRLRGQRASELDRGPLAGLWRPCAGGAFRLALNAAASSLLGRSSRRLGVFVFSDPVHGVPVVSFRTPEYWAADSDPSRTVGVTGTCWRRSSSGISSSRPSALWLRRLREAEADARGGAGHRLGGGAPAATAPADARPGLSRG